MKLKEETFKKKKKANTNSKQKQESCVHPKFCGTLGAGRIQKREIRVSSWSGKDCKGEDLQCLQCDRAAGRLSHTFPSSAFLWQEKCVHFPSMISLRGVRTAMPSAHDLAATKSRPNLTMVRVCVHVHAHVCARVFFSLACLHESKVASKNPWNLHYLWKDHVSWQSHGSFNKTCSCPNAQLPGTGPHQPLLTVSPVPTRSAAALPFKETVSKYF